MFYHLSFNKPNKNISRLQEKVDIYFMSKRPNQTYTSDPKKHVLDVELANILMLSEDERVFVTYFLSGNTEQASFELTAKHLNIPVNTGYNRRLKVKQYIAISIKEANQILKRKDSESVITVTEVVENLAEMLRDKGEEARVRVKSGEVLLKHMNGFAKHNESRASKTNILINNLSDEELQQRLLSLKDTILATVDITPNQQPRLIDLSTLSEEDIYEEFVIHNEVGDEQ